MEMDKEQAIQQAFDESATEHHDWFKVDVPKFLAWLEALGWRVVSGAEGKRVAAVLRAITPGGPVDLLPDEIEAIDRAIELLDPPE